MSLREQTSLKCNFYPYLILEENGMNFFFDETSKTFKQSRPNQVEQKFTICVLQNCETVCIKIAQYLNTNDCSKWEERLMKQTYSQYQREEKLSVCHIKLTRKEELV